MLVDRITKETTDISRDLLDMTWWLDEGETITRIVSQKVTLGAYGWSDAPYPLQGGEMPYDPFPLEIQSATITGGGLEVFVAEGSPSLAYTCQFVLDGSSTRRVTIEMGVQVTGVPLGSLGSGPLPSYLAVTISDTPPSDPQPGQLWFDSYGQELYIWYDDPSSSEWVVVTANMGGISADAPHDGHTYGRNNANWVNIGNVSSSNSNYYYARDFGCLCDGVTDDGATLNTALQLIPPGTTMYIPGSLYTTQTIVVADGRRLEGPPGTVHRPIPNDHATWISDFAIIGPSTLSPIVLFYSTPGTGGPGGGLTNIQITRNGTPAPGTIGLQCIGGNQVYSRVWSWNHAIGIQCGAKQSAPVMGQYVAITCAFDHCVVWMCYENFIYLVNAPEMSFYDMRFGINGGVDVPSGVTALVTIDGDNNSTAAGTNTLTFLRGQFNSNAGYLYSILFKNVAFQGPFKFIGCYSGGAQIAFCYIDPSCTLAQGIQFEGCTFAPIHAGETFFIDPANKSNGLRIIGNDFGAGDADGFKLSGHGVIMIGNNFYGAMNVQLDSMTLGCCIGNVASQFTFTGTFTGNFTVSGNYGAVHAGAVSGPVIFVEQNITTVGGTLSILSLVDNNPIQLAQPSNSVDDFLHLLPRDPIDTGFGPKAIFDTPFLIGTSGGLTALAGGQGAAPQIKTQIAWIAVCANTGNGVLLPPATAGMWQVVTHTGALNATVFATGSDTINTIAGSTGYTLLPGKTLQLYCYQAGHWFGGVLS